MDLQLENSTETQIQVRSADDSEYEHWSDKFGISIDELLQAAAIGITPAATVEAYVKKQGDKF